MSKSNQTISLCMIVRNEERLLGQCLASLRDFVDEIVVVDTGSRDATLEIARQYGARVYEYPWTGDFSEARNHSIAHATGDWILVVDADETIAARDGQQLRSLVQTTPAVGFKLIQRTYLRNANVVCALPNPQDYAEGEGFSDCVQVDVIRLFRNLEQIRYQGRVHELVEPVFVTHRLRCETTRLVLHHFGKVADTDRLQTKKLLYLDLGRQKVLDIPEDAMAQFELGVQLFELERFAECIPYFENSVKLNATFDIALLYLAKAHHLNGAMDQARQYYQKCMRRGRDNDKVLFEYANFIRDQGHFKSALGIYQKCLIANPRHSLALFNTGAVYVRLGESERGLDWIRRALQINPDNVSFYENLGLLALRGSSLEEAASLIEKYLQRSPREAGCHALLAEIYFKMKQFEKAIQYAQRAIAIKPELVGSVLLKANAHFTLGQLSEADESYRSVLLLSADNLDAMMNLAAIAELRGDYISAKAGYRAILSANPVQAQALKRYVLAQVKSGFDADPWPTLERAYDANPNDLECLLLVAGAFERSGRVDMALSLYRLAGHHHPEWTRIIDPKLERLELIRKSPSTNEQHKGATTWPN